MQQLGLDSVTRSAPWQAVPPGAQQRQLTQQYEGVQQPGWQQQSLLAPMMCRQEQQPQYWRSQHHHSSSLEQMVQQLLPKAVTLT
jgi:hypothetical protein